MDIKQMTMEQLKSLAYDYLISSEQIKNNLSIVNAEIIARTKDENKSNEGKKK